MDLRKKLAELLIEYKDIFAWSSKDLDVIYREFMEHKLGFPEGLKLVFKKKKGIYEAEARDYKKRSARAIERQYHKDG